VAFKDVYELKEEVKQTGASVCRRCLHRVTAVEYSVKVVFKFLYNAEHFGGTNTSVIIPDCTMYHENYGDFEFF